MAINISAKSRYMARNPVVMSISGDNGASVSYFVVDRVTKKELYAGVLSLGTSAVSLDLSFVFASLHEKAGCMAVDFNVLREDGTGMKRQFLVYGGGISKLFQRYISEEGDRPADVFRFKLKNVRSNFFLTTRTNANIIYLPENEAGGLYYYSSGMSFRVMSDGEIIERADGPEAPANGDRLSSLSVTNAWRSVVALAKGKLCSVFEIVATGEEKPSCMIVVTASRPTDYFLRFRNSYGVYEQIALYGVVEYTPEFTEPEDIQVYDSVVGDFVRQTRRKEYVSRYTAGTGPRRREEMLFFMDMLVSPQCELLVGGMAYAAKVRAEAPLMDTTSGEPIDLKLEIELLDTESAYSPMDFDRDELNLTGVLTDNFGNVLTDNFGNILTE